MSTPSTQATTASVSTFVNNMVKRMMTRARASYLLIQPGQVESQFTMDTNSAIEQCTSLSLVSTNDASIIFETMCSQMSGYWSDESRQAFISAVTALMERPEASDEDVRRCRGTLNDLLTM